MSAVQSSEIVNQTVLSRIPAPGRMAIGVFVLATSLSLIFSLVVFPLVHERLHANIDPDRIGELTRNLYEGRGYVYTDGPAFHPAMNRGPAYPFVVVLLYLVSGGESVVSIQVAQAVLHGLLCVVVFFLGRRLFGPSTAFMASTLCAIHPMLLWYTSRVWVETFLSFIVVLLVMCISMFVVRPTVLRAVMTGVVIGIAALTKAVVLPFCLILLIYLIYRRMWVHLPNAILILGVAAIVVAPWTIRNHAVSGEFVPVTTSLGVNMMQGDAVAQFWQTRPFQALELQQLGQRAIDSVLSGTGNTMTDPAGDRRLVGASMSYNLNHPLFILKRILINGLTFWYLSDSLVKSTFLLLIQLPLVAGVIVFFRRKSHVHGACIPVILFIGYYYLAHLIIIGWARYSLPIVPLCLILVSHLIVQFREARHP